MSRPGWLAVATLLSIMLAACSNSLPQNSTQLGTPTKLGTVEFAEGLSVRALSELLSTSKLDAEYALFTQTVAGEETVGGILIENKDLSKLESTLQKGTEDFIADMALTDTKGGKFKVLAGQAATAVAASRITGITGNSSQTDVAKLLPDLQGL